MGISDTFASLAGLSAEVRLELCAAALSERDEVLQTAAVDMLLGAGGLDRADVVVDRFDSLLPAAVAAAAARRDDLVPLAAARVRADSHPDRLAAHVLLARFGGDEVLGLLERGIEDERKTVREVVCAAIEQRLQDHCALARQQQPTAALPPPGPELWHAAQAMIRAVAREGRNGFVGLVGEFGVAAVPLIHQVVRRQGDPGAAGTLALGLQRSSPQPRAELTLALVTHQSAGARAVGEAVLGGRADGAFASALARLLVTMGAPRRRELPGSALDQAIEAASTASEEAAALALLHVVRAETEQPEQAQRRVGHFVENPAVVVQCEALRALERLGFPAGHAVLAQVMREAPDEVRRVAAEIVLRRRPADLAALLTPLLGSRDPELRELAQREVLEISLPHFLEKFRTMDPRAREVAAGALAKIDPRFVERLGKEFLSLDSSHRLEALQVVELISAEADLHEPLLAMLEDPDLRVRATAIRIVEATASEEGVKVLIDALSHPDRRLRANAIEAFEELDDPRYIDLVRPFLRDRDNRVRANAAKAMWNLGCDEGRETLRSMITHDEPMMRISAAWAIGELRFEGARALLEVRERVESTPGVLAKIRQVLAEFGEVGREAR